jgi:adenine/guanine phosphoribosyltransferase-like PRPP-binding protein
MPGVVDDIIIKGLVLRGMFQAAEHAGAQVEKHGLLGQCKDLDAKLKAAYIPFRDTLEQVTEAMEKMVTDKVVP